jgi:putative ABC transport system permease protein
MRTLVHLWSVLRSVLRRRSLEKDLDSEVRAHLALLVDEHVRAGMTVRDAERAARIELGGIEQVKEQVREARVSNWLQTVVSDCRFGLRQLRKNPNFTAVAVVALAIGIGANAGVFSVVDALLLRSLPFREPSRLVALNQFMPPHDSVKDFQDWRCCSDYLSDSALYEEIDVNINSARLASRAHLAQVSANFFSVLGTRLVIGGGFLDEDEADGAGWGPGGRNAVAVIGYGLWQQLFGGDPKVLGSSIRVGGVPLTVVGVAQPGFDYPGRAVVWKPAAFSRGNNGWHTIGRLKRDVTWPQARAAFEVEVHRSAAEKVTANNFDLRPKMESLQESLAGPVRLASKILMALVFVVLMIACANVASLLLARNTGRVGELSIRSALGATAGRLARQLITECLVLSIISTFVGLLLAYWITTVATRIQPPPLEGEAYSIFDGPALVFVFAISTVTVLMFGALPSLYFGRFGVSSSRKTSATFALRKAHVVLLSVQVVLAIILLAGSVSLERAFGNLMRTDRGYDVANLVTINVSLDGTVHQLDKRQLPYFEEVLERIRSTPDVGSASATEFLPLYASAFIGGPFGVDGVAAARSSTRIPILSGYFSTMGTPVLSGREFTDAEVRSGAAVAIVNERFATNFGPAEQIVGHQLTLGTEKPLRIVGVVKGMEYETDPTLANGNQVFVPAATPGSFFSTFVVRVNGRAEDHVAAIRDAVQSVDPLVPVFGAKTMQQRLDEVFVSPKSYRTVVWFFAGFALILALIGIYGSVSYLIGRRSHEMGVRMALGTTPLELRSVLLRQSLWIVLSSASLGIVGAWITGRFLEHLVYGAKFVGVASSVGMVMCFALAASVSCWVATRPISRIDIRSLLSAE